MRRGLVGSSVRWVLVPVVAVVAAVAVAACGSAGTTTSAASPQQLLQDTFSGQHAINSGVASIGLTVTPTGSSALQSPISLSIHGPFQSNGTGKLPDADFTMSLNVLGHNGQLGIITTQSAGYVTLNGTPYQLPASDFQKLESSFANVGAGGAGGLSKLGIDPLHWVTNPTTVGTETIDGTSTTHIRANVNVAALLDDINTFLHKASTTGASSQIPGSITPAARQQIAGAIKSPVVDVWTGTSDHILRKLTLNLSFSLPSQISSSFGITTAALAMTVQYTDVNQPQTITAPANPQPFSVFQRKLQALVGPLAGVAASSGLGNMFGSGGG